MHHFTASLRNEDTLKHVHSSVHVDDTRSKAKIHQLKVTGNTSDLLHACILLSSHR